MEKVILNLILGLMILLYGGFTVGTLYLVFVGKKSHDTDWIGKILYYHGTVWIIIMIATATLSLVTLFGSFISKAMGW